MTDPILPGNLPESWEPGQIVAPHGTDVGLTEQHGYNYLMKQVNATQRVMNEQKEQLDNKVTLLTESLHLYVSKEGDDEAGDGTEEKPFLTIQKAVETASRYHFGNLAGITITIHPGVYTETVLIWNPSSTLQLRSATLNKEDVIIDGGEGSDTTLGMRRSGLVAVHHITLKGYSTQASGVVSPSNGGNLVMSDCAIESDGGGTGAHCGASSNMHLNRVEINNCRSAVYAGGTSFVHAMNLSGTGNEIGYHTNGGIITRNGTYVSATTATSTGAGGQVWPSTPQVFDLPLAVGVTPQNFGSKYWKNASGEVNVILYVVPGSGQTISSGTTLGTLPLGYRPPFAFAGVCSIKTTGSILRTTGSINFNTNGAFVYYCNETLTNAATDLLWCTVTFPAAQ